MLSSFQSLPIKAVGSFSAHSDFLDQYRKKIAVHGWIDVIREQNDPGESVQCLCQKQQSFSQKFTIITERKSNGKFGSKVSVNSLLLDKSNRGQETPTVLWIKLFRNHNWHNHNLYLDLRMKIHVFMKICFTRRKLAAESIIPASVIAHQSCYMTNSWGKKRLMRMIQTSHC